MRPTTPLTHRRPDTGAAQPLTVTSRTAAGATTSAFMEQRRQTRRGRPHRYEKGRRRGSRLTAVVAALATAGGTMFAAADVASATGTGRIIASPCLTLRGGASTSAAAVACIPYNTTVGIDCTTSGDSITGPYGATSLWDHTSYGGQSGFVTDAWVYTGTAGAIAGQCASSSPSSREQRAVSWVAARAGSSAWNGLCETMVENAYGTRYQYSSAIADYQAQRAAGRIHTDTNPPAGVLVFYSGNSSYGHVEIANGDGRYWTNDGTIHLVNFSYGGTYYGWSYAPTNWPGA